MTTTAFATLKEVSVQPRPEETFIANPNEGRVPGTLDVFGDRVTIKISSRDTGGEFAVIEALTPPLSGPPLHIHHEQDEWWHILEGTYRFEVDGREIVAGPGAHVYAPRGTSHTFQNLGTDFGKMVVTVVPGRTGSLLRGDQRLCRAGRTAESFDGRSNLRTPWTVIGRSTAS